MKIAVVTNPYIKQIEIKEKLIGEISQVSSIELVFIEDAKFINKTFDKVLVFGGDGTILRAAKEAAKYNIPLVGIDLGRLGFLAQFARDCDSKDVLSALYSNDFMDRMLLNAISKNNSLTALNEIVVKSTQTKPIYLDLYIDDKYVDSYHADGIIVASPTGSTAYSLSAGGPVLSPDLDAILIIPICPHSLHSRSLVVSSNSMIEIRLKKYIKANVSVDGELVSELCSEESVKINKSNIKAKFVEKDEENFYEKLLEKMNKWGITE